MQPAIGCPARNGAGNIQKIAVAVGARAQHRVAEGDSVRLAPGHISTCGGPVTGLIGRAGPGRRAAHRLIGAHQAQRHGALCPVQPHIAGADEVKRADIQRRGHTDARPVRHQPLGKQRAAVAMVEAAINMGRGYGNEMRRAQQPGAFGNNAHRHGRTSVRVGMHARRDGAFVVTQIGHWSKVPVAARGCRGYAAVIAALAKAKAQSDMFSGDPCHGHDNDRRSDAACRPGHGVGKAE